QQSRYAEQEGKRVLKLYKAGVNEVRQAVGLSQVANNEMANFPKGKYDDLTDSATQAINYLRLAGRAPSRQEWAVNESMREFAASVEANGPLPLLTRTDRY